jgi:hypothetical protein
MAKNKNNDDEFEKIRESIEQFFESLKSGNKRVTLKDIVQYLHVINLNIVQLGQKMESIDASHKDLSKNVRNLLDAHNYIDKILSDDSGGKNK